MLKTIGFVVLWLVGSAAAVGVAWTGVSVVDDDLVDPAPATTGSSEGALGFPVSVLAPTPLATAVVSDTASPESESAPIDDGAAATTVRPTEPGPTPTPPQQAPTTAPPTAVPPGDDVPPDSTTPSPTAAPASSPTTTQAPTPPPSPSPTVPDPTATPASTSTPTPPPPPTAEQSQVITYSLVGGSTAISFTPSGLTVLCATPNPGFEVRVEPESPGVKVEFEADHHESRIDAWWAGGPQHEIREEPED
ncbi:MAG: hypothetical protein ACR2QO_07585 [Acidimicrobiales bacterium]